MWKFKSWKGKDKWLSVAAVGVILCILAFPVEQLAGRDGSRQKSGLGEEQERTGAQGWPAGQETGILEPGGTGGPAEMDVEGARPVSAETGLSYEEQLERRIRDLLIHVDGVGRVDVMVVLKASSEKILHMDENTASSLTEETDGNGNRRKTESREERRDTVLSSGSGQNVPVIQKELYPEISGIIISASGGGSPAVCAEISAAMEALFGLPAHKIKVLKRVE